MNCIKLPTLQSIQPESDCELSLFQSSLQFDIPPALKHGLGIINSMIELHYLEPVNNELRLTSPGIDYMFKKHQEFIRDIEGKDIDFGPFHGAICQLRDEARKRGFYGHNTVLNFQLGNSLFGIGDKDDSPNYNNIRFKKKNDKIPELEG